MPFESAESDPTNARPVQVAGNTALVSAQGLPLVLSAVGAVYLRSSAAAVRALMLRAIGTGARTEADRRQARAMLIAGMQRGGSVVGWSALCDLFIELCAGVAMPDLGFADLIAAAATSEDESSAGGGSALNRVQHPKDPKEYILLLRSPGTTTERAAAGVSQRLVPVGPTPQVAELLHAAVQRQMSFAAAAVLQRFERAAGFGAHKVQCAPRVRVVPQTAPLGMQMPGTAAVFVLLARRVPNVFGGDAGEVPARNPLHSDYAAHRPGVEALRALLAAASGSCAVLAVLGDPDERRRHVVELLAAQGLAVPTSFADASPCGVWAYVAVGGAAPLIVLEAAPSLVAEAVAIQLASAVRYVAKGGAGATVWDACRVAHGLHGALLATSFDVAGGHGICCQVGRSGVWPAVVVPGRTGSDSLFADRSAQELAAHRFVCYRADDTFLGGRVVEHYLPAAEYASAFLADATVVEAVRTAVSSAISDDLETLARGAASALDARVTRLLEAVRSQVDASEDASFRGAFDNWTAQDLEGLAREAAGETAVPLSRIADVFLRLVRILKDFDQYTQTFFVDAMVTLLGTDSAAEAECTETSWACTWATAIRADKHDLLDPWHENLVYGTSAAWRLAAGLLQLREDFARWLLVELPWFTPMLARKVASEAEALAHDENLR